MKNNFKAILFDLDGTLIDVNMNTFIARYFKLLSEKLSDMVEPKEFISKIMKASKAIENNNGEKLNEEAFKEKFFPINGYQWEDLKPIFDDFYETDFSKLKKYTDKVSGARKVVQKAFDEGYIVVIATTPLLPKTAALQRLDWAGLGDFPYEFVTSYEDSHATKPNLYYYEEILEKIDCKPERALMVGDDEKDLVAAKLGCKTFWVENDKKIGKNIPEPTYKGKLIDLLEIL
jgi:HAD superfamily hydrolase (TIGR01549 family)